MVVVAVVAVWVSVTVVRDADPVTVFVFVFVVAVVVVSVSDRVVVVADLVFVADLVADLVFVTVLFCDGVVFVAVAAVAVSLAFVVVLGVVRDVVVWLFSCVRLVATLVARPWLAPEPQLAMTTARAPMSATVQPGGRLCHRAFGSRPSSRGLGRGMQIVVRPDVAVDELPELQQRKEQDWAKQADSPLPACQRRGPEDPVQRPERCHQE